jgi:hypothetical protein
MSGLAYTGVGSRKTPPEVLERMRSVGYTLARAGYLLRSGGADGADQAFERGAKDGDGAAEIYVPWPGFNDHPGGIVRRMLEAEAIARSVHPAWDRLSPGAKKCHTRNVHQVLGFDLHTPSLFVVCWTPDGCTGADTRTSITGGTATAILVAERYAVPVFNLKEPDAADRLEAMLGATLNARWAAFEREDAVTAA